MQLYIIEPVSGSGLGDISGYFSESGGSGYGSEVGMFLLPIKLLF